MIEEKTIYFMEETSKTINEIEKNFAVHLVEQKSLCKDVSNIDKKIDDLIKELKEQNEKNEKRFSGKWVEKTFIGIGAIAGTIILGAILTLIIKPDLIK